MYYDTIRFQMNVTENVYKALEKYFDYATLQHWRKKKEVFMKMDYGRTTAELVDFETGEIHEVEDVRVNHKILYKLPSYNYDINICVQPGANLLICEFSIPKYLYGHNLNLFPAEPDKDFKKLYHFCVTFVKTCFNENLHKVDFKIDRLDICYNYKFEDEVRKSDYIDVLERYVLRHNRKFMNFKNETFMKKTEGYSVKIYDKTKEFKKHDLPKLRAYYLKKGLRPEVIEKLLTEIWTFAQGILRVELTARKMELNAAFWRTVEKQSFQDKPTYIRLERFYKTIQTHINQLQLINKAALPLSKSQAQKHKDIQNFQLYYLTGEYFSNSVMSKRYYLYIKHFDLDKEKTINVQQLVENAIHPNFRPDYKKMKQILSIKNIVFPEQFNGYYTRDIKLNSPMMNDLWGKMKQTINQINRYCSNAKPIDIYDYLSANETFIKQQLGLSVRTIRSLHDYLLLRQRIGDLECKKRSRKTYYRQMKIYDRVCERFEITENSRYISEFLNFDTQFKNYDKKILV